MQDFISCADLRHCIDGAHPVVVMDVRGEIDGVAGAEQYARAHIPGARYVEPDTAFAGPFGGGARRPLPPVAQFEACMGRLGIRRDSAIVVYDDGGIRSAARAWWCLRYFGLTAVRVLDGGFRRWAAEGHEVTTALPQPSEALPFTAHPGNMPLLDAPAAAQLARTGVLIDARSPERFDGIRDTVDFIPGHIPGAVNVPPDGNIDSDGLFISPEAFARRVEAFNVQQADRVGVYCGSGIAAAQAVLALRQIGVNAGLYVGSWSDWISDPARAVEVS